MSEPENTQKQEVLTFSKRLFKILKNKKAIIIYVAVSILSYILFKSLIMILITGIIYFTSISLFIKNDKFISKRIQILQYGAIIMISFIVSLIILNTFGEHRNTLLINHPLTSLAGSPSKVQTPVVSRYPGCDTDDIILPNKMIFAACNVGASKASQYITCRDSKIACPEEIGGKNFKWGNNEPYESGSTIVSSTGANAWGAITKDNDLMRGPCAVGYHIPSAVDMNSIVELSVLETFDPNNPWKPKDHKFTKDFSDYLKIPYQVGYICTYNRGFCSPKPNVSGAGHTGGSSIISSYFWTSELSLTGEHHPVEVKIYWDTTNDTNNYVGIINYRYQIGEDYRWYGNFSENSDYTNTSEHAIPVRCMKDIIN